MRGWLQRLTGLEVPACTTLAATLVVAASLVLTATAPAADYSVGATAPASPATSPLPDPCPYQAENPPDQINWENTEVEPQVAVNPTNPNNVIGVFQEDRWTDGGAHGLLAAVSFNGGASYINDWAEFSACSDRPETPEFEHLPRATDPWVSFDAAGRAYQIGLPIIDGSLSGESAITASYSTDSGLHWSAPVDITRDDPVPIPASSTTSSRSPPTRRSPGGPTRRGFRATCPARTSRSRSSRTRSRTAGSRCSPARRTAGRRGRRRRR